MSKVPRDDLGFFQQHSISPQQQLKVCPCATNDYSIFYSAAMLDIGILPLGSV